MNKLQPLILSLLLAASGSARAAEEIRSANQIIRPWQSTRSAAMGNLRLLTGVYEENFFSNPARHGDNPTWRVQLPVNVEGEIGKNTIDSISAVVEGIQDNSKLITNLFSLVGKNNHVRVQLLPLGVFVPGAFRVEGNPISIAFGTPVSLQGDVGVHRNNSIAPFVVADAGAHLAFAGKFLPREELSFGLDLHADHRVSTVESLGLSDIFKEGTNLDLNSKAGSGTQFDVDLGSTYILPWTFEVNSELVVGASLNNLLGGDYSNLGITSVGTGAVRAQPRAIGFGIAARRPSMWLFDLSQVGIEVTDIGNNQNGSFFRLLHIGAETNFSVLAFRAGFNQGYPCAGLGIDLKVLSLDAATYGEELTLNAGKLEDRRYIGRVSFHI